MILLALNYKLKPLIEYSLLYLVKGFFYYLLFFNFDLNKFYFSQQHRQKFQHIFLHNIL
jgi:hypothetical protein